MEKLKANPGKSLRSEGFQIVIKPVETSSQVEVVQDTTTSQESASGRVQTELVRKEVGKSFITFEEFLA